MKKKLRLYVWENVLGDWTPGIMFALASSVDEARRLLKEQSGDSPDVEMYLSQPPLVVDEPQAFIVRGGS